MFMHLLHLPPLLLLLLFGCMSSAQSLRSSCHYVCRLCRCCCCSAKQPKSKTNPYFTPEPYYSKIKALQPPPDEHNAQVSSDD
jgi:hypothetical protein